MYKIRNKLITVDRSYSTGNNFDEIIFPLLKLYDAGLSIDNSPYLESKEWRHHKDHVGGGIEEGRKRQVEIINLYESLKTKGYDGSKILAWFDDDGKIHIYDGFHRLTIMKYLKMDELVNVDVDWRGVGPWNGRDFPLEELLFETHPKGKLSMKERTLFLI